MSFKLTEWARKQCLSPGPKSVLINLCERADDLGVCFPSQNRIAKDTGYSVRTVRRHIKTLEERGFIERERRQKGYIRRSDSYMMKAPVLDKILRGKMAGADEDTLSCAEPDKMSAANESPDKYSNEPKGKNYIKILDQDIYTGDRGKQNNPAYSINQNFTVYRREYEYLLRAFPAISDERLLDLMASHDNWLDKPENAGRPWLPCLLAYLRKVNNSLASCLEEHV